MAAIPVPGAAPKAARPPVAQPASPQPTAPTTPRNTAANTAPKNMPPSPLCPLNRLRPPIDLPGGTNFDPSTEQSMRATITRDIGADEYVGPLRRVEFGVQGGAYTVVSAEPLNVLIDPVNTVLDDPTTTGENPAPTANPGITIAFDGQSEGARIELYVRDATNHPIDIIAFGADMNDWTQDTVLMSQPEFQVGTSLNVVPRNGDLDSDVSVDWEEEIPEEPDSIDANTIISAWVSFAVNETLINAGEETAPDSGVFKLGYRSGLAKDTIRGVILIDTNANTGQTGFPYWWANFQD